MVKSTLDDTNKQANLADLKPSIHKPSIHKPNIHKANTHKAKPGTNKAYANPHTLMVQGTTSDAGKSVLVTALCRVLARQGIKVAPFKSQNMALNSAVTPEGGEIGRAQAVQAYACNIEPSVLMNPVLLKPNSDLGAQVIVRGSAIGNMQASVYHQYKPQLLKQVVQAYQDLQQTYEVIFVEGAGSPAEINLRQHDLANMGFAEAIDCPVIIVADIDRGGVFAHLYGTFALLSESEQNRVEGFVINRFRGDIALLQSGLDWLENITGKPVLAVLPYIHNLHIEAEDAVAQEQTTSQANALKVVVPMYPRASNHTDFDALRLHPQVDCQLLRDIRQYKGADLIILPGSKNTRGDLAWLKQQGWDTLLKRHLRLGGKVMGICGGYQMLGHWIHDPTGSESAPGSSQGLGLLAIETHLTGTKQLRNVQGHWQGDKRRSTAPKEAQNETKQETQKEPRPIPATAIPVTGYEIHVGSTTGTSLADDTKRPVFSLKSPTSSSGQRLDGAINQEDTVMGTYVHGLFEQSQLLNRLLVWAGGEQSGLSAFDYQAHKMAEIDRLADALQVAWPVERLYSLLGLCQSRSQDSSQDSSQGNQSTP